MGSKSILILGVVVVFLINVLAVHDYVNNNYYSTKSKPKLKPIVLKQNKSEQKKTPQPVENKKHIGNLSDYKAIYKSNLNKEYESTKDMLSKKDDTKQPKKDMIPKSKENMNSLITIDFNIEQKYENNSPVIKKLLDKFDKNKKIVIEIFQYSSKIQDYLKEIKTDLVERGVDIDDILTIYKKNKNKKNKIKLLLVKKD